MVAYGLLSLTLVPGTDHETDHVLPWVLLAAPAYGRGCGSRSPTTSLSGPERRGRARLHEYCLMMKGRAPGGAEIAETNLCVVALSSRCSAEMAHTIRRERFRRVDSDVVLKLRCICADLLDLEADTGLQTVTL